MGVLGPLRWEGVKPTGLPSGSLLEIAWAAGFFDGEGCVTGFLDKSHKGRRRKRRIQLIVGQSGTTEHLERFSHAVGIGNVTGPYHRPRKQPSYHWQASGTRADRVMRLLRPFLCTPKVEKYDLLTDEKALSDLRGGE